jgi:hypothetical protein
MTRYSTVIPAPLVAASSADAASGAQVHLLQSLMGKEDACDQRG